MKQITLNLNDIQVSELLGALHRQQDKHYVAQAMYNGKDKQEPLERFMEVGNIIEQVETQTIL